MQTNVSSLLIPGATKLTEERVLKILKADHRNEEDALYLYHNMKMFSFFEAFFTTEDGEVVKDWCLKCFQTMKYETYRAGEVIITQGDQSNGKAYIIYSGEVSVIMKDKDPMSQKNYSTEESSKKKTSSFFPGPSRSKNSIGSRDNIDDIQNQDEESKPAASPIKRGKSKQFTTIIEEPKMDETVTKFKKALITGLFSPDLVKKPKLKKEKTQKELTQNEKEIIKVSVTRMKSSLKGNKLLKKLTTSVDERIDVISRPYGTIRDTIKEGGYFGERALIEDSKRVATIMANKNTIVLTIHKDDIEFVKFKFDAQKYKVFDVLCQAFPEIQNVSSNEIKDSYVYLTEDRTYAVGSTLFDESDPGTKIYILYSGICEVYRNVWVDESTDMKAPLKELKKFYKFTPIKTRKITIAQVNQPGTVFGEDILFQKNARYHYSVKVISPEAKLISITKSNFLMRFPFNFKDDLRGLYEMRTATYNSIVHKEALRRNIVLHNDNLSEHLVGHVEVSITKQSAYPKSVNPFTGLVMDSPKNLEVINEINETKSVTNKHTNNTNKDLKTKITQFSRKDFIVPDTNPKPKRINPYNPNEISSPVIRSDNLSTSRTYENAMDKYMDMAKNRNSDVTDDHFRLPHLDYDEYNNRKYKLVNRTNNSVQLPYLDLENSLSSNRSMNISKIKNYPHFVRLGSLSKDSVVSDSVSFITNMDMFYSVQPNSSKAHTETYEETGIQLRSLVPSNFSPRLEPLITTPRDPLVDKYIHESLFHKNMKKRRRMVPPLLNKSDQMKKLIKKERENQNSITLFESLCL